MSQITIGEFEELILLIVANQQGSSYGVSILEAMEEIKRKKVNISAIHVALKRLESKGLVSSVFGGITQERGGRRKKFYSITALGKSALDENYSVRTQLYKTIPAISFD